MNFECRSGGAAALWATVVRAVLAGGRAGAGVCTNLGARRPSDGAPVVRRPLVVCPS
ncbi:hypothetical protein [Acidovorax sp. FHTAMBA]|jgi:hypothetical protein|uniref:hypothetical protein n=1 Tax=Acidovorax sp. FHTAMBA TaxID=3140252 RepID=UPI0015F6C8F7